jgi:hypothetical protein
MKTLAFANGKLNFPAPLASLRLSGQTLPS